MKKLYQQPTISKILFVEENDLIRTSTPLAVEDFFGLSTIKEEKENDEEN